MCHCEPGGTLAVVTPAERLERTNFDTFWVPLDGRILDRDDLHVLGCDRAVPHVNICHRVRADVARVPALVDEAIAFMSPVCSRFFVTDTFERGALDRALRERGYVDATHADARIAAPTLEVAHPDDVDVRTVDTLEGIALHTRLMTRAFGTDDDPEIVEPERKLEQCTGEAPRTIRYIAHVDGEPVATSGLNWFPTLELALLWGGSTLREARGRGCYRAMVARRLADAAAMGARFVGLYAVSATSGPIVDALGFEKVGDAWFWRPEGAPGPRVD